MSHSHQQNQPPTHAHSHLITDHPHLHPLTGTTFKHTPLTHSSASLKVASYSLVTVYLLPRICRSAVCLPRKGRVPRAQIRLFIFCFHWCFELLFTWKPDLWVLNKSLTCLPIPSCLPPWPECYTMLVYYFVLETGVKTIFTQKLLVHFTNNYKENANYTLN